MKGEKGNRVNSSEYLLRAGRCGSSVAWWVLSYLLDLACTRKALWEVVMAQPEAPPNLF